MDISPKDLEVVRKVLEGDIELRQFSERYRKARYHQALVAVTLLIATDNTDLTKRGAYNDFLRAIYRLRLVSEAEPIVAMSRKKKLHTSTGKGAKLQIVKHPQLVALLDEDPLHRQSAAYIVQQACKR